ncbi:hypothetical protein [Streptomyces sp. NPDC088727]|uniref:hypothetical protein n=1 Tax=Streptomyces sp. NPDC088727 TaxID=3365875 RepID=UPI003825E7AE
MSNLQELAEMWAWYVGQEEAEDGVWRRVHLVHEDGSDEVLILHSDSTIQQIQRTAEDAAWQRDHLATNPEKDLVLLNACRLNKEQRGFTGVAVLLPEAEASVREHLLDGGLEAPESGFFETYSTAKEL